MLDRSQMQRGLGRERPRYTVIMSMQPWPDIPDRLPIDLMEELLADTEQTPNELRARARQLRGQAEAREFEGQPEAALALADRYEQAARAGSPAHHPATRLRT